LFKGHSTGEKFIPSLRGAQVGPQLKQSTYISFEVSAFLCL
jgi:hypothetical protein